MTEQEYRDLSSDKYYSYSFLKNIDKYGVKYLIKPEEEQPDITNAGMLNGSLIELLAWFSDQFEDTYYVSELRSITATEEKLLKKIIEYLELKGFVEKVEEDFLNSEEFRQTCREFIDQLSLWKNLKNEDLIMAKIDEIIPFVLEHYVSLNRIIIDTTSYLNAQLICKTLKESDFSKEYFTKNDDIKNKQILLQIPILYEIKGKPFKSLLDLILIDHKNKTVRVVDLKTSSFSNNYFKSRFLKLRYDIQAALYLKAVEKYLIENDLKDYKILNSIYLHVSTIEPDSPLQYEIDYEIIRAAYGGFTTSMREYKGIFQLIDEVEYARENKIYHYTKEQVENKKDIITPEDYNIGYIRDIRMSDVFQSYGQNNRFGAREILDARNLLEDLILDNPYRQASRPTIGGTDRDSIEARLREMQAEREFFANSQSVGSFTGIMGTTTSGQDIDFIEDPMMRRDWQGRT